MGGSKWDLSSGKMSNTLTPYLPGLNLYQTHFQHYDTVEKIKNILSKGMHTGVTARAPWCRQQNVILIKAQRLIQLVPRDIYAWTVSQSDNNQWTHDRWGHSQQTETRDAASVRGTKEDKLHGWGSTHSLTHPDPCRWPSVWRVLGLASGFPEWRPHRMSRRSFPEHCLKVIASNI